MNPAFLYNQKRRQRGQTIIVAMIILGLLLLLGFIFLGIINRSIRTSGIIRDRSLANDLSEAGIRYAHEQLLHSAQGADWRGGPTIPIDGNSDTTVDPDAFYLRPPATVSGNQIAWPGSNYADLGGPDGLGPFFRVPFRGGRALVRVRYAPSDANIFRTTPNGPLRQPGAARNYIIIESVGREGIVNPNDPTALTSTTAHRIRNYASAADFQTALNEFRAAEARFGGIQVNRAFASIGIIETARFITNKYRVSRPASIGIPNDSGTFYRNGSVADLPTQLGTALPLLAFDSNTSATSTPIAAAGSLFSNADIELHGRVVANLNLTLGDQIDVAGNISGDDDAQLLLNISRWQGGAWPTANLSLNSSQFNSHSPTYNGAFGALRDGSADPDPSGFARGAGRKDPPSAFGTDVQTRTNRYLEMTRGSGVINGAIDTGALGYGAGVYVDNFADRQTSEDELGRANTGGENSLINDWLNPSNPNTKGWRGYLYIPPGAYVRLLSDGFVITRDGRNQQDQRNWKLPNGTDTGNPTIRYRLGRGTDGALHIVNSYSGVNITGTLGANDYQTGPVFNGVLYFEGNARVRGVIPTDIQLTLVSRATIYVEGSITKGINGNHWTATYSTPRDNMASTAEGQRITRPSKSMLMLIAKDYVAVNTTQFFGASPNQDVQPQQDVPNLPTLNPVLVRTGGSLTMQSEFLLDPNGAGAVASNPSTYPSFANTYATSTAAGSKIPTNLLLIHTMDDGPAPMSFVGMDVNAGFGNPVYQFPTAPTPPYANGASAYLAGTFLPLYGLGTENYQRFGKFEGITLPLVDPAAMTEDANTIVSTGNQGSFTLFKQGTNELTLRPQSVSGVATNDYVLGRLAIAPHDIRIEASMFAEDGSFFVIPGPWFNPNPNDSYAGWYAASDNGANPDKGNAWRLENFGSTPNIPFYGEPLDVRIVIVGAVSENMPPTTAQQAEWIRKWGWIPKKQGAATTNTIPYQHLSDDPALVTADYVPNILINYDPVLATGRRFGFFDPSTAGNLNDPATYVRSRWIDYNLDGIQQISELVPLPPLPRLPVSPTLAYFGEVH